MNKKKIINDPVYGFISIQSELAFEIIEHPFFQRLRHIKQLGLTDLVFPGAIHTRFQHALGSYHLMGRVLENLRNKGIAVSFEEAEAAQLAVLMHDIGHGPFSHSLEETLLPGIAHESLTYIFLQFLNTELNGKLDLALKIFRNSYSRKFFHQLVSGQLDIDRLDYLRRDSFFTGVEEGTIGTDRIIDMITVAGDSLAVEEKGIYSVENFLNARRLMYWQVYLHKTSVSAERMLVNIIKRAQYLSHSGENLPCTDALKLFLRADLGLEDFRNKEEVIKAYGQLDDHDIWGAIKLWSGYRDKILSTLCKMLIERNLFQIRLSQEPIDKKQVEKVKQSLIIHYGVLRNDVKFLFSHGMVSNEAYLAESQHINILTKSGRVIDIAQASDLPQIKAMSKIVKKNFLCWPKHVSL